MDYFSMFSGIGGFEYGIERGLGFGSKQFPTQSRGWGGNEEKKREGDSSSTPEPRRTHTTELHCIGFSEIDKYAKSIYKKHYPNHLDWGDATRIRTQELPEFQLLVGGFPCQAFSIAGKREGFNDTRGTLFFEIARILKDKRPRHFLLENVAGLLSHDNGKTFQTILRVLTDLGYGVEYQVLNSKDFGVPQNRERVFIVGHLGGLGGGKVFPVIGGNGKALRFINGVRKTVVPVLTPDRENKRQNGRRFKTNGEPSFTCTAQDKHGVYDGQRIRRLTPVECERLQGFPDNWTKYGCEGELISDSQRYKCLGNAVTTTVISAIINQMSSLFI